MDAYEELQTLLTLLKKQDEMTFLMEDLQQKCQDSDKEVLRLTEENLRLKVNQDRLKKENSNMKTDNQTLQEQLNESISLNSSYAAQLQKQKEQIARLSRQIQTLQNQISALSRCGKLYEDKPLEMPPIWKTLSNNIMNT